MPSFTLPSPQSSIAAALPSTVIHGLLLIAAIWLSQAAPIDLSTTHGPIDITFQPVSVPHPLATSTSAPIASAPVIHTPDLPILPRITSIPWHPGTTTVDPASLTTDPGTPSTGSFSTDTVSFAQIFRETEVDELPSLLSAGRLRYPPVLAEMGIDGAVTLTFVIDADGKVDPVAIDIISATHPGFVEAAKETARTSLFHPARKHGAAVRVRVRQTITFKH